MFAEYHRGFGRYFKGSRPPSDKFDVITPNGNRLIDRCGCYNHQYNYYDFDGHFLGNACLYTGYKGLFDRYTPRNGTQNAYRYNYMLVENDLCDINGKVITKIPIVPRYGSKIIPKHICNENYLLYFDECAGYWSLEATNKSYVCDAITPILYDKTTNIFVCMGMYLKIIVLRKPVKEIEFGDVTSNFHYVSVLPSKNVLIECENEDISVDLSGKITRTRQIPS